MNNLQINTFSMSQLSNAFHASFHHVVTTQLVEIGDENLGLPSGFTSKYLSAVKTEQDIVNRTLGSEQTELLREQDTLRDNYFRSIRNVLRNTKYSANGDTRALYAMIQKKLLKPYPASICKESDHTESAHIRGFIYDVRQFLTTSQRNSLGIEPELTALEQANEAFESIYLTRVDEYVQNPAGLGEKCRKDVDEFWLQLVRTVNYYANETQNPSSEIAAVATNALAYVESLNKHIEEFLRSVKASKNRSGAANDNTGQSPDDNGNDNTEQGSDDNDNDNKPSKPSTGGVNEKPEVNDGATDKVPTEKPATDKDNNTGMGGDL